MLTSSDRAAQTPQIPGRKRGGRDVGSWRPAGTDLMLLLTESTILDPRIIPARSRAARRSCDDDDGGDDDDVIEDLVGGLRKVHPGPQGAAGELLSLMAPVFLSHSVSRPKSTAGTLRADTPSTSCMYTITHRLRRLADTQMLMVVLAAPLTFTAQSGPLRRSLHVLSQ